MRKPLPDPAHILERAAILEFCEGLPRAEADVRALGELGLASWEALALMLAAAVSASTGDAEGPDRPPGLRLWKPIDAR